LVVIYLEISN